MGSRAFCCPDPAQRLEAWEGKLRELRPWVGGSETTLSSSLGKVKPVLGKVKPPELGGLLGKVPLFVLGVSKRNGDL